MTRHSVGQRRRRRCSITFDGYRQLYLPGRSPGPIVEAGCWVHARRPFFAMADLEENARRQAAGKNAIVLSPIAIEVVRRISHGPTILFQISLIAA